MTMKVHSATVVVNDQDDAIRFYTETLGFEKLTDDPIGDSFRWVTVAPPGSDAALALLRPQDLGQGSEAVGKSTGISLSTDDLDGTYERYKSRGVRFDNPPEVMPWGGKATTFQDHDGNSFFLAGE